MAADLSLPVPVVARRPFTSYKVISFDIFGTLIDYESGVYNALQPLLNRIPLSSPYAYLKTEKAAATAAFNEIESPILVENPGERYCVLLEKGYLALAAHILGEGDVDSEDGEAAKNFGAAIGSWPAWPDTVEACQRLQKHFKLVPLSNVDKASFEKTRTGPLGGIDFWKWYVAEDIGSYKPDLNNFHYLIDHAKMDSDGVIAGKEDMLHVAQSLTHDHVPAKEMEMASVWIVRPGAGYGLKGRKELHEEGKLGYGWRFDTLKDFADAVEKEIEEKGER